MVTETNNKNYKTDLVVSRLRRDLRNRLANLSAKKGTTIAALNNEAVIRFLENEEFNLTDLMEKISHIPLLRIHEKIINEELKNCPGQICREILETISHGEPFLLKEKLENVPNKIKGLEIEKLSELFLHILTDKINVDELNKLTKEIDELVKGKNVNVRAVAGEQPGTDSVLVFVVYKKGDEQNETEK